MKIEIPDFIADIINRIESNGYEAWLVGGCVRDSLLNKAPKDYDVATSAIPEEISRIFKKTAFTGEKYGTVTVYEPEGSAEVTTFRRESDYRDYRRPSNVTFTNSIAEDLSRRDFTVNAMAYNPSKGLYDPFEGQHDLTSTLIRAVGHPEERFNEDALRMFRAFRFAARLGFTIEPETLDAIRKSSQLADRISGERIKLEIDKILITNPVLMPDLYDVGIIDWFNNVNTDEWNNAKKTSETVASRWAALFYCGQCEDKADFIFDRLRFDNKTKKIVKAFIDELSLPLPQSRTELKKRLLAFKMPSNIYNECLLLFEALKGVDTYTLRQELESIIEAKEPYCAKMLAITGNDLIGVGIKPGPVCKMILNELVDYVILNPNNNSRETLLDYAANQLLPEKS